MEVFGKSLGVYFHNAAKGVDDKPVREAGEAESISRIGTLKENTRDLAVILEKSEQFVAEIGVEIAEKKLLLKQLSVMAVMADLSVHSRSQTLEKPTNDMTTLNEAVRLLFDKFLGESELEIRRVGVKISRFSREDPQQKQLSSFFS